MTATHPRTNGPDGAHIWRTRSTHPTSEGLVTYQACACGRWRILGSSPRAEVARSPY